MAIKPKVVPEEKLQNAIIADYKIKPSTAVPAKKVETSSSSEESSTESDSNSSEVTLTDDSETEGESSPECGIGFKIVSIPLIPPPTCCKDLGGQQLPLTLINKIGREKLRKHRNRKETKEKPWTICLTHCRYEIVRSVGRRYELAEVNEDETWNIYWTDFSVSMERAIDLRRNQIINHFPGMNEICRKDLLARNLNRMKRLFSKDYDIYPKSWSLPADLADLQSYALCRRNKIYICKPEMGCQGRGIFLIRNIKDLNPFGKIVCQLYLAKPFLIDGYKFDLRLYALITSVDPLRVYLYKEGLARFATAKYKPPTNNNNTENSYMHLTNYAINKFSRDYVVDDEGGSKRRLTSVYKWLKEHGHNTEVLIEQINDVIIKTILCSQPILKQNYNYCFPDRNTTSACFEILGFDIIFDHKLKPYVLEVNHSPSFHTDARLDLEIKEGLLDATFAMLNFKQLSRASTRASAVSLIQARERKCVAILDPTRLETAKEDDGLPFDTEAQSRHELENCGGYCQIYPTETSAKYDRYYEQNWNTLVQERIAVTTAIANKNAAEINANLNNMEELLQKQLNDEKGAKGDQAKVEPQTQTHMNKHKKSMSSHLQLDSFTPNFIKPEEELERTKLLMQRGMLIRSLGIEIQVYKLLRDMGGIKAEEEKLYQRLYGHCCKPLTSQE